MENHDKWMRLALGQARRGGQLNEVPVGAVVVQGERLVGIGFNRPISGQDPTAHAEIEALRDAARTLGNYRLVDCDLYVTLEPCGMCVGAIVHARVRRVIFGALEPKSGACCSQQQGFEHPWLNHRVEVIGGVLAQPAGEILSNFFKRRRQEAKQ